MCVYAIVFVGLKLMCEYEEFKMQLIMIGCGRYVLASALVDGTALYPAESSRDLRCMCRLDKGNCTVCRNSSEWVFEVEEARF